MAAGLILGLLADQHGILSPEAAWRGLRASQILFGATPSLRSLGYDLPPLPTLLELPLAVLPGLRSTPVPGSIVAGAAAVIAALSLLTLLRGLGLAAWLSAGLVAAALLHPLTLYGVATGSGDVLGVALLLVGVRFLLDWVRTSNSIPLVAAAFAIGFAGLARYDLVVVAATLTAVVAMLTGPAPGQRLAFAIAFGTPAAAILGLWLVLNALATGNPLTFAAEQYTTALAAPATTPHTQSWILSTFGPFLLMAPAVVPALLGAVAACSRRAARPALVLVMPIVTVPLAAMAGTLVGRAPVGLMDALPLVWLSGALLGAVLPRWSALALPLVALGAAGAVAPILSLLESPMWRPERDLAATIRKESTGRDVLVDDRRDVLPVFLTGEPAHFVAPADPDFGSISSNPRGRVRLVLVHSPAGDGLGPSQQTWPRVAAGEIPWAELVGEWPVSGQPTERYRLFRVRAG
jgi:hypothetical protein